VYVWGGEGVVRVKVINVMRLLVWDLQLATLDDEMHTTQTRHIRYGLKQIALYYRCH
jgi:hypothetical protein